MLYVCMLLCSMYVCTRMHVYVLKEGVVGVQVVSLVCERSRCPCVIATYMDYMMDVLPTTCRQQTRQQLKSEKKKDKMRAGGAGHAVVYSVCG